MNTPSPLQPMGRLPEGGSGKPGFNIAIISIVALHVVFFGGLLLQGCSKPATDTADLGLGQGQGFGQPQSSTLSQPTNPAPADPFAGYGQPYGGATNLAGQPQPGSPGAFSFTNTPGPATNLWTTTPSTEIPSTESAPPPAPPAGTTEYKVVKGDTPATIARKHGISTDQLREANPGLEDRKLQIAQKLQIPAAPRKDLVAPGTTTDPATPAPQIYVVKAGDNLNRIATRHGVSVKELRAFNSLKTDRIVVNQKIKIPPAKAKPAPAPAPAPGA